MLKKVLRFIDPPSNCQKQNIQRALAELNNVRDVTFDQNQAVIQLYADTPDEVLVEHSLQAADLTVIGVK